jgi:hypothetical protein
LEAGVAQSVEQLIRNEKVEGSIPFSGTKNLNKNNALAFAGQCVVLLLLAHFCVSGVPRLCQGATPATAVWLA